MAEDEDLEVLRALIARIVASDHDEANEGAGDKVQKGPHRPIVPTSSKARIGASEPRGLVAHSGAS